MKNLREDCYNPFFSHIYIERGILEHPGTKRILGQFPQAKPVVISHYKDVFCRSGQDSVKQHMSQNLILAEKTGKLIYEGARVCQSFGNPYFYYTSCMMNCIFDCEYCYLKGMYPSGNIVIFVNLEDFFEEVLRLLESHPVYLCVSFDTDLLAIEGVAGYARAWSRFAEETENLKIEIRTKSGNMGFFRDRERRGRRENVIFAFTLSPVEVIKSCEHFTAPLTRRLACAKEALRAGYPVRLCFDPMIYCPSWQEEYDEMLQQVFDQIDMNKITDVSIGTFRVSQDYLKKMRKMELHSAVVQFPYENDGGVYHYPEALKDCMEQYLTDRLKEKIPEEKIFLWE